MKSPFAVPVSPNADEFLAVLKREAEPARVHPIEIYLDQEVEAEIADRFSLVQNLDPGDPYFKQKRHIAVQRFLGYDYVLAGVKGLELPLATHSAEDENKEGLGRVGGRQYVEEGRGQIGTWEEFERFPWPQPEQADLRELEWYEKNLPDDMCVLGGLAGHVAEELSFLMGYETLCITLYDDPDLVAAIRNRVVALHRRNFELLLQFPRVRAVWGTDDMGFRTGTLLSPEHLREYVLPAHREFAHMAHSAGRLYLLHSCGNLGLIMEDIIDYVKADAKHSFEDTIENVADAKERWGDRISFLGGIDVDFLCRSSASEVRDRTRRTLDRCGSRGYCLGTGNSVANYVPIPNYLAMLDEGRLWTR